MELIDWQPGNGTRYLLAYGEVNGNWFVSWLTRSAVAGPSCKWSGCSVDLNYMAG